MIPMVAVLCLFVLPVCKAGHAPVSDTLPAELFTLLSAAGMAEPEAVARVLTDTIGLQASTSEGGSWLADLREFDATERSELYETMRSDGVALADRSKLRRLAFPLAAAPELVCIGSFTNSLTEEATTGSTARQLQQQSGGSLESVALAITALLGMASYLVDAKLSRDAKQLQKESDALRADNARAETKVAHLLSRVQGQMEHFVQPFTSSSAQSCEALFNTLREVGLASQIDHWQLAWLKVPIAPHIEVFHFANPASIAAIMKSPYFKLVPRDIAVLEGDLLARQRYTELVVATWLPPMRVLVELFTTRVRVRAVPSHRSRVVIC
jgi:hypothetical protein